MVSASESPSTQTRKGDSAVTGRHQAGGPAIVVDAAVVLLAVVANAEVEPTVIVVLSGEAVIAGGPGPGVVAGGTVSVPREAEGSPEGPLHPPTARAQSSAGRMKRPGEASTRARHRRSIARQGNPPATLR